MQAVFSCVTESHDLILVALAAFICALGIFAAFGLAREAARAEGGGRIKALWSLGAAASLASAIWATHFIAMLAYQPGMAVSFEIPLTALSYVVAIAPVGAGGAVLAVARGTAARLSGGAILGLAISAMHYTGMAAYRVQGVIEWDHGMVAMSTVLGVLFSVAAVLVAYRPGRLAAAAAPTLMVLAVCATHFVGMTAAVPRFDPAVAPPADFGNVTTLVTLVANVALVIVAFSLAAVWVSFRDRLKLAAEEKRLRDLADIAVEGLLICDGERIVGANSSIESLAGCARADLVGRALEDVVSGLKVRDVSMQHEAEARIDAAGGGIPVRVIAQEISLGGRKHVVVAVRDQRERLRTEAEMVRLAYQDALTGLANRASFAKHHDELEASRVETRAYALFTVDLDRFKEVNDTLGHAVGDELLRRVAGRLKSAVRGVDAVARLGGDEFSALAPGVSDPRSASAIAERIIDLCARPYLIDGKIVEVSASVGVAFSPADGDSAAEVARAADLALYDAKQRGGDGFRLFETEMNERALSRRSMEIDLRRALGRNEFSVSYQPQVDPRTGEPHGAEALIRWRHPIRGMVPPVEFIPLAEELGLINEIGEWVLRTACRDAASWQGDLAIAVNLSPVQLRDPRLPAIVADALAESGLPARRLELEVTETALIQDEEASFAALTALRNLGVRLAMDDFGTGYSSLSHLRRFPFDKIKIDRSFLSQLPGDADSASIVQAVIGLAGRLGMQVTAEGVETEGQRAFVAREGCGLVQGYLTGRPAPIDEIAPMLDRSRPTAAVA